MVKNRDAHEALFGIIILLAVVATGIIEQSGTEDKLSDEFDTMSQPEKITIVYGVNTEQIRKLEISEIVEYTPFGLTRYENECYIKYVDLNNTEQEVYIMHPRAVDTDHGHLIIYV